MQQNKEFEVGDIVKFKNCRDKGTKIPAGFSGDSKEFTKHGVTTFKENKGIIKGIVGNYFYIEYIGDNNKPVCLGFTIDKFELLESKQKQYYTSIPTDVQVGDKFVVCCNLNDRGQDYQGRLNSLNLVIGDIVTLDGNDGTINPYFSHKEDRNVINWGCLKPVEVVTNSHLADVPPTVLFGKDSLGNTDIQQFEVGDEVELIEIFGSQKIGDRAVIIRLDLKNNAVYVDFKHSKNYWIYTRRLKLINKTNYNYGKVHSTTNDICRAFVPDIRSKEIHTGQVFSKFNIPKIRSGY